MGRQTLLFSTRSLVENSPKMSRASVEPPGGKWAIAHAASKRQGLEEAAAPGGSTEALLIMGLFLPSQRLETKIASSYGPNLDAFL